MRLDALIPPTAPDLLIVILSPVFRPCAICVTSTSAVPSTVLYASLSNCCDRSTPLTILPVACVLLCTDTMSISVLLYRITVPTCFESK